MTNRNGKILVMNEILSAKYSAIKENVEGVCICIHSSQRTNEISKIRIYNNGYCGTRKNTNKNCRRIIVKSKIDTETLENQGSRSTAKKRDKYTTAAGASVTNECVN